MNESLISGLLGAVMGGATSIEKSLAEEEAARRKEEEEKRREERAITLAERQEAMREARKAAQEKVKMERVASYIGPETQITPGTNPMEPEAATSSKVQLEQRLTSGIEAAISKGDTEAAKLLSDQYTKLTGEKRAQAKEERDVAKALAEPMEKTPERIKVLDELTGRFYKQSGGGYDEEGNPTDAKAFASASKKAEDYVFLTMRERMGIAPGAAGPKPLSMAQEDTAQGKVRKIVSDISTDQIGKAKVKNTAKENALGQILSDYQDEVRKANPEDSQAFYRIDLNTVERELRSRLKTAQDAAAAEAGAKFTEYRSATKAPRETDEQFKARKEAILPNQLHRAFADNKKSTKEVFVEAVKDDFLSSAPKSQTAEPATKTVTDVDGKKYTVRRAPNGKYYREENGQFFEYKGP